MQKTGSTLVRDPELSPEVQSLHNYAVKLACSLPYSPEVLHDKSDDDRISMYTKYAYKRLAIELWDRSTRRQLPIRLSCVLHMIEDECSDTYESLQNLFPDQNKEQINNVPRLAALNGVRRAIRKYRKEISRDLATEPRKKHRTHK